MAEKTAATAAKTDGDNTAEVNTVKKESELSSFMLVNQLIKEYWQHGSHPWTDEELKAIESGDIKKIGQIIRKRLEDAGATVKAIYIIIHDQDFEVNFATGVYEPKEKHIHVIVKFPSRKKGASSTNHGGLTVTAIADALGVLKNMIEIPHSGKYSWDNFLAYLIHAKDEEKTQYSPSDVVTILGPLYQEIEKANHHRWERGKSTKTINKAKEDGDWLFDQIMAGNITRQQILRDKTLARTYALGKTRLDHAFDVRLEMKADAAQIAMDNGDFTITFIYAQGKSHRGKSKFAKALIPAIIQWSSEAFEHPWEVYKGGQKNVMDEYAGEEIIFLDEIRGAAMSPEDWVALVDPEQQSKSSARYKNKKTAARVIIMTSPMQPLMFFLEARKLARRTSETDPVDQFLRRLQFLVRAFYVDELATGDEEYIAANARNLELSRYYELPETKAMTLVRDDGIDGAYREPLLSKEQAIIRKDVAEDERNDSMACRRFTRIEAVEEAMKLIIENNKPVNERVIEPIIIDDEDDGSYTYTDGVKTWEVATDETIQKQKGIPIEDYKAVEMMLIRNGKPSHPADVTRALVQLGLIDINPPKETQTSISIDNVEITVDPLDNEPF